MNGVQKIIHPATVLGTNQLKLLSKNTKGIEKLKIISASWKGPRVIVDMDIGPFGKGIGHEEFVGDAMQSYRLTILYLATSNGAYAKQAAAILQAWSLGCKSAKGANQPLECAWASAAFTRTAELLKYHWPSWTHQLENDYNAFLNNIIMPHLLTRYIEITKWKNNWILTIIEALMQIYLFQNNIPKFNQMIKEYNNIAPSTFITPFTGQNTETKRDICPHCQFQLASHVCIAEMCYHQGIDSIYDIKLMQSLEYHASIINNKVPSDITSTAIKDAWFMPGFWDIAYNHYVNRRKQAMPETLAMFTKVPKRRPEGQSFNWGPGWCHENSF